MHFFSDYIQPLTTWIHLHPHWALFITFLISFSESLAVIGSIIPGSVTMTAIGILAGSGVIRIDLTAVAAILGAIAGDSASYMLGYFFSERLSNIWPFSRYPNWLLFGKDYFDRHGGKSVLIGRFVGPLRSIIPVIAGMMRMRQWRFFLANALSAIGWAFLYLLPGILIGAASNELSSESATQLFLLILLFLAFLWLLSVGLKWLFMRLNIFLRRGLHAGWMRASHSPYFSRFLKIITPPDEKKHYPTVAIVLLVILSLLFFLLLTFFISHSLINKINQPIHLFLQSLRIVSFDIFFIAISQLLHPIMIGAIMVAIGGIVAYFRDWRSLVYWISLCLSVYLSLLLLHFLILSSGPPGLWKAPNPRAYPNVGLTYLTSLFTALIFFLHNYGKKQPSRLLKIFLAISLFFAGFSPLYLGDNWLSDTVGAYLCGFSLCLIHWLFYRRQSPRTPCSSYGPFIFFLYLILISSLLFMIYFNQSLREHQPYFEQYVFTDTSWWNQTQPILPLYRSNRFGKRVGIFNVQYAGSLSQLEYALTRFGWKKLDASLVKVLLTKFSGQPSAKELPLITPLYLNKKPALMMIYKPKNAPLQVLQMWSSNYHLNHLRQPLWIGSISFRTRIKNARYPTLTYLSDALFKFKQKHLSLHFKLPTGEKAILLLIKENSNE